MKKKVLVIGGSLLALGLAFGAGNIYTRASSDWATNAQNAAYSELLSTASSTTNTITNKADTDINNTINNAIQNTVDDQQKQLQDLLDQYYKMKLAGLTQTNEFKNLESQIATIKQSVFDAYKKQIDDAFNNAQQH